MAKRRKASKKCKVVTVRGRRFKVCPVRKARRARKGR